MYIWYYLHVIIKEKTDFVSTLELAFKQIHPHFPSIIKFVIFSLFVCVDFIQFLNYYYLFFKSLNLKFILQYFLYTIEMLII